MKTKIILSTILTALCTAGASAQSAIDAYNLTPTEMRGTARFVSMGGAFTSLGGDISCMAQNPAGLGLYRSSDLGFTLDISMRQYKSATNNRLDKNSETKVYFDNFGYVGVVNLQGAISSFQWGISATRTATIDRLSSGYVIPTKSSLTNYIASYTNGVDSYDLLHDDSYNPFYDSTEDWLSILAYNSYLINNNSSDTQYAGLHTNGTYGDAMYKVRERGSSYEYNIDFAGNVSDIFFWGAGLGITDLQYSRENDYSESMENALVYDRLRDNLTTGNAGFNLYNYQRISGTGANLKLGIIVRPIEMLRIGAAIHTPTWLHLVHTGYADVDYNFITNNGGERNSGSYGTPDYNEYTSKLNSPWRFMLGASAVLGTKAIVSADYEHVAYNNMTLKQANYDRFGGYVDNTYANADVKEYFKGANIFRAGIEYRVLPTLSVRAGYNWQGSAVKESAKSNTTIYTSGTDPSYTLYNDTHNISAGVGYRYRSWYIDAAYVHTSQKGTFHAYTPYPGCNETPSANVTNTYNNIVISTGFRF